MPALHDFRNAHGYPLTCCEFHGMHDGCAEGKNCPARKAASAKSASTKPAPQLRPFDWLLIAAAALILVSAYLY